jgi:hypothetical protein
MAFLVQKGMRGAIALRNLFIGLKKGLCLCSIEYIENIKSAT